MRNTVVTMSDLWRVHPQIPHLAWKATSPIFAGDGVLFFCHHSSIARSWAITYFRHLGGAETAMLRASDWSAKVKVRRAPEYDRYLLKDEFGRPHQAMDIESLTEDITPSND